MSYDKLKDALVRSELARAADKRGFEGEAAEKFIAHFAPAVSATSEGLLEVPGHLDLNDLFEVRANELKQFTATPAKQAMPPLAPNATPEERIVWANESKRREVEAAKAARAGLRP